MTAPHVVLAHVRSEPVPVVLRSFDTPRAQRTFYRRELRSWENGGFDGDVIGIEMSRAPPEVPGISHEHSVGADPAIPRRVQATQLALEFETSQER